MQVRTTTIHVHVIPAKPSLQLHPSDRELVGVYSVDVDNQDYPIQHATAALNALRQNVAFASPDDFSIHVYDPAKKAWLLPPQGEVDFPSDGDFTGKVDLHLLPIGTKLYGLREEIDCDEKDEERKTPAGALWTVRDIDPGSICLICEETSACIFASVCQLGTDFKIDKGYAGEEDLSADDLDNKYKAQGGGEHPMFSRLMWREAVANQDTITGYWGWVESELGQASWGS